MGGGGSGPGNIDNIESLVNKAKQELSSAERAGRLNVFISFAYEDVGAVNLLRGQAKNENLPLEFNDWSVSEPIDSERAPYIKQKISERISHCSATVIYLTDSTPKSRWVDWEIEESIRQGKHVVGVFPQSSRPSAVPDAITKHRIKCVPWPKLSEAIGDLR